MNGTKLIAGCLLAIVVLMMLVRAVTVNVEYAYYEGYRTGWSAGNQK
jgi:hypothetical protein